MTLPASQPEHCPECGDLLQLYDDPDSPTLLECYCPTCTHFALRVDAPLIPIVRIAG